jgi:ribosome biogenesis protein YTM1
MFCSGSHDQTIMLWQWDLENNKVSCKWVCKGHKRSVDALRQDPSATVIASGSWDGELKIWSASLTDDTIKPDAAKADDQEEETSKNTRVNIM